MALTAAQAVRQTRRIRARLVGAVPWRPLASGPFSEELDDASGSARAFVVAIAKVQRAADAHPGPAAQKILARLDLLQGNADSARSRLARLVSICPQDWMVQADLSAAFLERARSPAQRPLDAIEALDAAKNSLAIVSSPEAMFNRALAAEDLGLETAASENWSAVARGLPDDGWAREAEQHREVLERARAIRTENRSVSGETGRVGSRENPSNQAMLVRDELLAQWVEARASLDNERRDRIAARIGSLADSLPADYDSATRDIAELVRRVPATDQGTVSAIGRILRGRRAYENGDFTSALREDKRALLELPTAAAVLSAQASLQAGLSEYMTGDFAAARRRLATLAIEAGSHNYLDVRGKALWVVGLIDLLGKRPLEALDSFQSARLAFEANQDQGGVATIEALLADAWSSLGEIEKAWTHRRLSIAPQVAAASRRPALLVAAAVDLVDDWPRAAEELATEARLMSALLRTNRFDGPIEMLFARARLTLGDEKGALGHLEALSKPAGSSSVSDPNTMEASLVDLLRARAVGSSEPRAALSLLDSAANRIRDKAPSLLRDDVLLERARIELALALPKAAEEDLWRVLGRDEKSTIEDVDFTYRRVREPVGAAALDLLLPLLESRGAPPEDATCGAELAREKALRAEVPPALATALGLSEQGRCTALQASLRPNQVVVHWAALANRCVRWVVTRHSIQQTTLRVGRESLERSIDLYLQWLRGDNSTEPPKQEDLDALLAGSAAIRSAEELLVVPDELIARLPISALRLHGTPVGLRKAVVVVPSMAWIRRASVEATRARSTGTPLLVGAPAISDHFDQLAGLPSTEKEMREVRQAFPGARLLSGTEATQNAFRQFAPAASWIHFAGHAITTRDRQFAVSLLFAPQGEGDLGVMNAAQLLGIKLSARGVVLSACSTMAGSLQPGEGGLGLPYYFLLAGAREVVAALWPVSDEATRAFFQRFYRHLLAGESTRVALTSARRECYGERNSGLGRTSVWAAFQLVG